MNVYTKKDKVTYWEVSVYLKCSAMLLIIISSIQVWAERSSPFNPPTTTDRTFITDVSPGLDTRCTSRNEGPLIVEVKINRYVGEVDDDGYLKIQML